MNNWTLLKLVTGVFAMITSVTVGSAAWAQSATCGITGSATAGTVYYDPFNPTGLAATTITLNLTRLNPAGGGKTNIVNFFLKAQSAEADGTSIVPTNVAIGGGVAGVNLNIFHDFANSPPVVAPTSVSPSAANRFLKLSFAGNNTQSDTAAVTFQVTLPANLDLNAVDSLAFNAIFACSTIGGGPGTQQTGQITNAVVFPVVVLSALQASYVGPLLDFGEVGDKTTTQVQAAPATYTKSGDIRVASSGAYEISMTSTNNYRLTFPGGNPAMPGQSLAYSATLVGITRNGVSGGPIIGQTAITKTCARAGVGGILLPVSVRLTEGGSTKMTAPAYSDLLTVTVTPQAALVVGAACP
jgi:hypothetical protein